MKNITNKLVGILMPLSMQETISRMADAHYDGNFSMATRRLIEEGIEKLFKKPIDN